MNSSSPPTRRPIRSYVLRQGRISQAQQRAYSDLAPHYVLPYQTALLDWEKIFTRAAPRFLEIGFGMGESTAEIAQQFPERDFIGVEVHTPGVGSLLKQIQARALSNIRIIQHDAVAVLQDMIAGESLAGIHIFFPDPWPKLRHHKRRLLQAPFIQLLASRLQSGGYVHIATDWEQYAETVLSTLQNAAQLENTSLNYAPRPTYRPLTKFEQRGLNLGHGVWDMVFRKRGLP